MDQYNWATIPVEELNEKTTRQVVHTERMTIARLQLRKGAVVGMHHHENEQVTTLQSGELRFVFGGSEAGKEIVVRSGDLLQIPSNVPHMVEALEDSTATDLFAPPRVDWIRGDDAYLRNPKSIKER